jgi:antitoxin component HigA of HigAB toxin-antitoxin module
MSRDIFASRKAHHATLARIYDLMEKGEEALTERDLDELRVLAESAERYETREVYQPAAQQVTLTELVSKALFEKKITRTKFSDLSAIPVSKVSEILNGKRKPDITFLKAVHKILGIDPGHLLELA